MQLCDAILPPQLALRPLTSADIEAVSQIEQQAHPLPWSRGVLADVDSPGALHAVLCLETEIIGYFYSQHIADEVTLLNIAIADAFRGRGYGRSLLAAWIQQCRNLQAQYLWLEVRQSNLPAVQLYLSTGFHKCGVRKGYYRTSAAGGREDAIVMQQQLFSLDDGTCV